LLDFNRMIDKLPNNGIEMDFKKLALLKTTHAWRSL
jgi:aryl carrier-like protein